MATIEMLNPDGVPTTPAEVFEVRRLPQNAMAVVLLGASGILGIILSKAGKVLLNAVVPAGTIPQQVKPFTDAVASVLAGVGGAMLLPANYRAATIIGSTIETAYPLFNYTLDATGAKRMIEQAFGPQAAAAFAPTLGSFYLSPTMGAEYPVSMLPLSGFAPGDLGEDESPNFPALAGGIGVSPDFEGESQYGESLGMDEYTLMGGGDIFSPALHMQ